MSIIQYDDDGVALVSTGSGFVIAPGLVVTNYHVVSGAVGADDRRILVSPPDAAGAKPLEAHLDNAWIDGDLAILSTPGLAAPALSLTDQTPDATAVVRALGYPGATCLALNCTANQMIAPSEPIVTAGNVSYSANRLPNGSRLRGLFHTAAVSPGSSGGPLVDACGRLVGVNTWTIGPISNGESDAQVPTGLQVATAVSNLQTFLNGAGVSARVDNAPCAPAGSAAALANELQTANARLSADEAALARPHSSTPLSMRAILEVSGVGFVLLAAVGAALLVRSASQDSTKKRRWLAVTGGVGGIAAVGAATFFLVPTSSRGPATVRAPTGGPATAIALSCSPGRESSTAALPLALTFDPSKECVDGRIGYARTPAGYERYSVDANRPEVTLTRLWSCPWTWCSSMVAEPLAKRALHMAP